ncbi:MAG: HEAT repeat domain-containing protein [Planctomycetes bacterium]|nr:HEAT repeat domain-containing protein [Planctomycetota bacterium]
MLCLLAVLLSWPGSAALTAQAPAPASTREERALAAEERRILSLCDGRKLRALSRLREDGWEVRDGNVWLVLPDGLVQRASSERELLSQLRELSSAVPAEDLGRRCELAGWMIQEGLLSEALAALDRILSADPEHEAARALIEREAIPIAFPRAAEDTALPIRERIDALLRFGSQSRPALRELVAGKLAALAQPELVHELLVRDTRSGVTTRRAFALFGLRRIFPGGSARELLERATFDPSSDVRAEAALGLRLVESRARVVPLVHVLAREEPALRIHAIEALGTSGDLAAIEPLLVHLARMAPAAGSAGGAPRSHLFVGNQVGYLRDFDVQIAQGSSIADPIPDVVGEGTQLDVKVIGMGVESSTPAAERRALCHALARLSGEKPSENPERWFAWWKQRSEAAERLGAGTPR